MAAKIRKNDLVEVVRGRTSDEKALTKRNARRAEEGLEPLKPGDKGKQGRAVYSMEFDSYAEVPRAVADEIVGKSRGN